MWDFITMFFRNVDGRFDWSIFWTFILGLATIFLAVVALLQNRKANNIAKQVIEIEESRMCSDVIVLMPNSTSYTLLSNEHGKQIHSNTSFVANFKNHGVAFLQQIEIKFDDYIFTSHLAIPNGEGRNVRIQLPSVLKENTKAQITFTSCYGKKTMGRFELYHRMKSGGPTLELGAKHYHYYGRAGMEK